MNYYLNLFSPETYEAFSQSDRTVTGFRIRQRKTAENIAIGSKLICYMTKVSRWIGILEIVSSAYQDNSSLFLPQDDPFVIRFKVRPLIWLPKEHTLPIREDLVWNALSFTKSLQKNSNQWTGKIRSSLSNINPQDGKTLENLLEEQHHKQTIYAFDEHDQNRFTTHVVRRLDKTVLVSVPHDTDEESKPSDATPPEARESIKVQALIAHIGATMGLKVWLPKADRGGVKTEWDDPHKSLLDILPLNYDETTLKTIEQIDVLWLRGRSIVRAFEVEHTTSIYSGILRMADLLALQPNMDIKLHIVAPFERRDKVFQEIRRPVFSLLEKGPLSESCTFLSYDHIRDLAKQRHLAHLSDNVLEEYAEDAE